MSIRVGRVLGVPIQIHATCIIALIVLSCSIGLGFVAKVHEGMSPWMAIAIGGLAAVSLFACLMAHEIAHAAAARRCGIRTTAISLFLLGGSADLSREPGNWRHELGIALAGPLLSIALGVMFLLAYLAVAGPSVPATLLFYLGFANALLGVVNLLPGYPLDGGRVLKGVLWRMLGSRSKATKIATIAGEVVGTAAATYGVLNLFGGDLDGLWLVAVGWYIADAAAGAWEQEQVRDVLEHSSASEIITDHPAVLSPDDLLSRLTEEPCYAQSHCHNWPVVDASGPVGVLTESGAAAVPTSARAGKRVSDVMASGDQMVVVGAGDNAWDVAERVGELDDDDAVMVADGAQVVGMVEKRELPNLLTARIRAMAH